MERLIVLGGNMNSLVPQLCGNLTANHSKSLDFNSPGKYYVNITFNKRGLIRFLSVLNINFTINKNEMFCILFDFHKKIDI